MRCLRKFLSLPRAERHLFLLAVVLLGATRVALRLLPFRTVHQRVERHAAPRARGPADRPTPERIGWLVTAAGRLWPNRRPCLVRAFTARILAARCGYPSVLRLGVARGEEGALEAHAWLECNGAVIVGGYELERYAALPSLGNQEPGH